jgi:DNA-binding NarL/FixJ family response regulator
MTPLRIVLVEDHSVDRRDVRALLESHAGWEIVAEATTGREAIEAAGRLQPDLVVMDLSLAKLNGLEATRRILKASPSTEVVVLAVDHSEELAHNALAAGARGYVLKSDAGESLIAAVESVSQHKAFLTPTIAGFVLDDYIRRVESTSVGVLPVTQRERQVIQLLVEGNSNKEAASALGVSVKTIESHRANIMRKLRLGSVTDLVRYAIRNKIVQP